MKMLNRIGDGILLQDAGADPLSSSDNSSALVESRVGAQTT
jgi:hypothetical protein